MVLQVFVHTAADYLREFAWRAGLIVSLSAVVVGFVAGILIDTVVGRSPRVSAAPALPVAGGCADGGCLGDAVIAGAFYTDSLASLPWIRTLLDKGLGAGSGMILLIAGVGTNLSTLSPVARVMGFRTAVVYAASVVMLSGVLGYLLNKLL